MLANTKQRKAAGGIRTGQLCWWLAFWFGSSSWAMLFTKSLNAHPEQIHQTPPALAIRQAVPPPQVGLLPQAEAALAEAVEVLVAVAVVEVGSEFHC